MGSCSTSARRCTITARRCRFTHRRRRPASTRSRTNLAVEWGRFGIRACGIAPGPIGDTEGMRRLAPGEAANRAKAAIPRGRFGTIDEIAAAAAVFCARPAAYVTGHTLVVDGGHCVSTPPFIPALESRVIARRAGLPRQVALPKGSAELLMSLMPARPIAIEPSPGAVTTSACSPRCATRRSACGSRPRTSRS